MPLREGVRHLMRVPTVRGRHIILNYFLTYRRRNILKNELHFIRFILKHLHLKFYAKIYTYQNFYLIYARIIILIILIILQFTLKNLNITRIAEYAIL